MPELSNSMRALMLTARDRLEVHDMPVPRPGPGQILVRMAASPVNPSDLMTLKGAYGIGAAYPFVPGLEGAGTVVTSGGGIMARAMLGRRVALATGVGGMWAEYSVVDASRAIPLPTGVSLGAGAMSAVNPLTAIALVSIARKGGHGAVVSTGAGGQLGRMIRKRAGEKGVKVINVVRRAEQVAALEAEGARHVLNSSDARFDTDLAQLCRDLRCRMAFDAVAGEMTGRLAVALGPRSQILVYGARDQAQVTLNPGTMIFREVTVSGFWLSKWLPRKPLPLMLWHAREATQALKGGFAVSDVARIVPLGQAADGIAAYAGAMSAGKTLIRLSDEDLGVTPVA
ncbi:alcohol dehydrogenase catalytic domain-containing protein [Roseicyclus mahoneyensis]|uniref:NADPH:quinone reductase-like Zn-dependent oxidoreductase n=1 Tax=Roseicyclus mahoneyensis TaxID=164332 RepID=A0A316GCK4_9RHOB|nr:zinc-binding dehydrogenase [Roseicyclus mahoneyensis]PWK57280.1 NADPH:quinone reductase-like Zn-dependent oxidoreductase [Roseicyclus mahoneyensis]